ncbi:hypothetical protein CWI37_0006p0020 [Hamiltosporidium tvaerminnensis]|uniref:Uncharacterized protein n=2 Tax=Hamiltosporidium TaxID=1176354 RepID=A0A4Q9LJE9_9MICR|nr:hypothetical protein CWI37_0006p0020 [Hamiltosporidium tvaerminnensis]TBU07986.1 hypothetical protein CWI36_0198p0010 [Hamiltosporidium magnivora]TBU08321.1 hypothetical protein CWI36_0154p0040 [Hamiltosporidium magnivora]
MNFNDDNLKDINKYLISPPPPLPSLKKIPLEIQHDFTAHDDSLDSKIPKKLYTPILSVLNIDLFSYVFEELKDGLNENVDNQVLPLEEDEFVLRNNLQSIKEERVVEDTCIKWNEMIEKTFENVNIYEFKEIDKRVEDIKIEKKKIDGMMEEADDNTSDYKDSEIEVVNNHRNEENINLPNEIETVLDVFPGEMRLLGATFLNDEPENIELKNLKNSFGGYSNIITNGDKTYSNLPQDMSEYLLFEIKEDKILYHKIESNLKLNSIKTKNLTKNAE